MLRLLLDDLEFLGEVTAGVLVLVILDLQERIVDVLDGNDVVLDVRIAEVEDGLEEELDVMDRQHVLQLVDQEQHEDVVAIVLLVLRRIQQAGL